MLRYAAGILCLLGSLALLYAGLRTPPKPVVPPAPDFTIDTPVKDFGEVDQFSELPATFTLTNTHPEPVEVLSVMKSCACASAEVTPKVIPPGGTGTLTTVWKVGNTRGKKGTDLAVTYSVNGRTAQVLLAKMTATVNPLVWCEPESVVFKRNMAGSQTIRLIVRGGHEIGINAAHADNRYFTAAVSNNRQAVACMFNGISVDTADSSLVVARGA